MMLLTPSFLLLAMPNGLRLYALNKKGQVSDDLLDAIAHIAQSEYPPLNDYLAKAYQIEAPPERVSSLIPSLLSPLSQVFCVVPAAWLKSKESQIPLTNNDEVKSLAALALASEVSHLSPDSVCYRYRATPVTAKLWQFEVTSIAKYLFDEVQQRLTPSYRLKGIVSADDAAHLVSTKKSRSRHADWMALSLKPRFAQGQAWLHGRCCLFILGFGLLAHIALYTYHASLQQGLAEYQQQFEKERVSTIQLAPAQPNLTAQVAHDIMQSLPLDVRINSMWGQDESSKIGLSLDSERLLALLLLWRNKWQAYDFQVLDERGEALSQLALSQEEAVSNTRSVLNVVIQIQHH